jgi:hypothetical protein
MTVVIIYTLANLLYCAGYAVRDVMWLRILLLVAGLCEIPYFLFQEQPLLDAVGWTSLFVLINGVNLVLLIRERRPVDLDESMQRLRALVFRSLTPRELVRLTDLAEWKEAAPGTKLVANGEMLNRLLLIYHGRAEVLLQDEVVAQLRDGQFIGEMSYVRRGVARGDVVVTGDAPIQYLEWERESLDKYLEKHPDLASVMFVILGSDLAEKLTGS